MRIERVRNAKRNIITGVALKGLTVLSPFVIRLIIIHSLGAEFVGLSSLFNSVLSILNLAELGIGSAIIFSMYEPVAADDNKKLGAILKLFRKTYLFLAILIFFVGVALMPLLPKIIKDGYPKEINIYVLYLIYLFNSISGYLFGAYRKSLYSVYQREDIINKVTFVVQIVAYLSQILILLLLNNYYCYAMFIALGNVVVNILLARMSRHTYEGIKEEGKLNYSEKRKILKGIGGLFLNKVAGTIRGSCDSIFLTMFVGLTMNALYSNYYYILTSLNNFILVFPQSIKAGIGNSLVLQEEDENYTDYMSLQFVYMFISGLAVAGFAMICQPFTKLFFGKQLQMGKESFYLMVLYLLVLKMTDINNVFVDAAGLWWNNKWTTVFDVSFNLIMDWILGKRFGLAGILLATLLSVYFFQFMMKTWVCFKSVFPNHSCFKYICLQHLIGAIIIGALYVGKLLIGFTQLKNNCLVLLIEILVTYIVFASVYALFWGKNRYFVRGLKRIIDMMLRKNAKCRGI